MPRTGKLSVFAVYYPSSRHAEKMHCIWQDTDFPDIKQDAYIISDGDREKLLQHYFNNELRRTYFHLNVDICFSSPYVKYSNLQCTKG
ncbi:hypothetical protein HDV00_004031 [Rhizophlyctis rosea]|nr:hypothetical protein HDV00_004031 [Rhizophlyctis rosea]